MATKNKRVALSLPLEVKAVYERAGKAMGIPTSRYISSILIEGAPAVQELVKLIEKRSPKVETLVDLATLARDKSNEVQADLIDEIATEKTGK